MKGNLILIHGGGPTAVINASLAGAIRQAKKEPGVDRILAAIGGTGGLMRGQVRDLTDITEEELALLERLLTAHGHSPVYVDLTREDLELPVVRAIAPGLASSADFDRFASPSPRLFRNALRG